MNEYNVGDLVEIKKGEVVVRDRLAESSFRLGQLYLPSHNPQTYINALPDWGWTVTVIEKAAPKIVLPSEPGFYLDREKDLWHLGADSHWTLLSAMGSVTVNRSELVQFKPETSQPFTRLEPENVTAKNVLDEVRESFEGGLGSHWLERVASVAAKFGVSS